MADDETQAAEDPEQAEPKDFGEEAIGHLDALYRGALRLSRDPDKAQDLVQDTYARALRYQRSYQPGTNMKAWLFAIMRNLYWDRFQKAGRESVSLDDVGEFALFDQMRDDFGEGPEAEVLDRIARGEVVDAIEKLSPLHREVVLLVDVEGFSYKDAATLLGQDGEERILAEEAAEWSGTISYEVLTSIGTRVERHYSRR